MKTSTDENPALDGFRALASLLVVNAHIPICTCADDNYLKTIITLNSRLVLGA